MFVNAIPVAGDVRNVRNLIKAIVIPQTVLLLSVSIVSENLIYCAKTFFFFLSNKRMKKQ